MAGGAALETLLLKAAYCVSYHEEFTAGDAGHGAYVCHLVLSDPDGWTLQAGGPAGAFVAPAAREHGVPGAAAVLGVGASQKLPVIPLTDEIKPAMWQGAKNLPSWTEEHKAARWAEYQRDKASSLGKQPKTQTAWDKQYETNRNNNIYGLAREREYAAAMGASSKILKTRYTLRQIDMFIPAGIEPVTPTYCGQLKTGFVYLTEQAKVDLRKDAWLVSKGQRVEYVLEKGGSKPLLTAISTAGATYKIGPQIP